MSERVPNPESRTANSEERAAKLEPTRKADRADVRTFVMGRSGMLCVPTLKLKVTFVNS